MTSYPIKVADPLSSLIKCKLKREKKRANEIIQKSRDQLKGKIILNLGYFISTY